MSDGTSDVVVIGAGIVGVSAAMVLAERGASVTVFERGEVAGEASGLNAGMIGGGGWGTAPNVEAALRMGSREVYVDLSERRGHDIELNLSGSLTLVSSDAEWSWATDFVAASESAGRCLELLDRQAVADLVPTLGPNVRGAVFDSLGARADPVLATKAVASEAVAAGASMATGRTVTNVRAMPGGGWEVDVVDSANPDDAGRAASPGGDSGSATTRADVVVVAAGPWMAELGAMLGLRVPIVPVRGQMWASEPAPPLLGHAIAAAESALAWTSEPTFVDQPPSLTHRNGRRTTRHLYGRQRANGEIVFGGDRVLGPDRTIDRGGIEVNHGHVAELVSAIGDLAIQRTWAGLMPFSVDGLPLVGPVPDLPGLYLAGGLASSGFGRGPMTGRLVASMVLGGDPLPDFPEVDFSSIAPDGRVTAI